MALDELVNRKVPSQWQIFLKNPSLRLAHVLQSKRSEIVAARIGPSLPEDVIKVVCISDTHNTEPVLPQGDLLIHAGDLTQSGTLAEMQRQLDWLNRQPHAHKIVVAGNHDILLDQKKAQDGETTGELRWGSIIYLEDSSVRLRFRGGRTLLIYGSPWTRKHGNWAFQYSQDIDMFTNRADDDVDILVTHSPPQHHLDLEGLGDPFLLQELWRVRPKLHVFGHIHAGYAQERIFCDRFEVLYEDVCQGLGLLCTFRMLLPFLLWLFTFDVNRSASTHLINASIVGGARDEDCRKPHVAYV